MGYASYARADVDAAVVRLEADDSEAAAVVELGFVSGLNADHANQPIGVKGDMLPRFLWSRLIKRSSLTTAHSIFGRFAGIAFVLLVCAGCANAPRSVDSRNQGSSDTETAIELQSLVMGWADDYAAMIAESIYLLPPTEEHDPRSRKIELFFLRNGIGACFDIGAGPNPGTAVLDLLVLSALQTWSFEVHWMPAGIGERGAPALLHLQQAEADLWHKARAVLSDDQLRTVRQLVDTWIAENPDRTVTALVRFDAFAEERMINSLSLREDASGLLRAVSEASGAIDDARLLGERLLWFSGRYRYLMGEQAELTAYRIADQPEPRLLLDTLQAIEKASTLTAARLETVRQDLEGERRVV